MKYLIDTNIFIILLEKSFNRLSQRQKDIIFDSDSELYLSEASLYEIGIKVRLGKENFSHINVTTIEKDRKSNSIKLLKTKQLFYTNIPNVPKVMNRKNKLHGDPFDLLIISQALIENLPILSTDEYFPSYTGLNTIS